MYVYSCVDRLNTEGGRDPASWLMLGDPTGYFSKLPQISSDLAYICIYIYMLKLRCLVTHEKLVLDPWCFPCLWTSIATTHTHTHTHTQTESRYVQQKRQASGCPTTVHANGCSCKTTSGPQRLECPMVCELCGP